MGGNCVRGVLVFFSYTRTADACFEIDRGRYATEVEVVCDGVAGWHAQGCHERLCRLACAAYGHEPDSGEGAVGEAAQRLMVCERGLNQVGPPLLKRNLTYGVFNLRRAQVVAGAVGVVMTIRRSDAFKAGCAPALTPVGWFYEQIGFW